jgi:hypothetical protein
MIERVSFDKKVTWTRKDEEERIKEEKAYREDHHIPIER